VNVPLLQCVRDMMTYQIMLWVFERANSYFQSNLILVFVQRDRNLGIMQ